VAETTGLFVFSVEQLSGFEREKQFDNYRYSTFTRITLQYPGGTGFVPTL